MFSTDEAYVEYSVLHLVTFPAGAVAKTPPSVRMDGETAMCTEYVCTKYRRVCKCMD